MINEDGKYYTIKPAPSRADRKGLDGSFDRQGSRAVPLGERGAPFGGGVSANETRPAGSREPTPDTGGARWELTVRPELSPDLGEDLRLLSSLSLSPSLLANAFPCVLY